MARSSTIPVRTRAASYDGKDPGDVVQLDYDEQVIPSRGLPPLDDIDILPFAANYRKQYIPEGGHPKHYEVRYRKDYTRSWWRHSVPARKARQRGWSNRTHLHGQDVEEISPDAGKVVARVSPVKLSRLEMGAGVFFLQNGVWQAGAVQEYQNPAVLRKAVEKVRKKAQDKIRRYLRQPTVWERLLDD